MKMEIDIDNLTIREVMEQTRHMTIADGGLGIFLEKIVKCIEDLQNNETK